VARMGEGRGVWSFFIGLPEGQRPLERVGRRCEDNIKMDLNYIAIYEVNRV
jgi:hypothetical protein